MLMLWARTDQFARVAGDAGARSAVRVGHRDAAGAHGARRLGLRALGPRRRRPRRVPHSHWAGRRRGERWWPRVGFWWQRERSSLGETDSAAFEQLRIATTGSLRELRVATGRGREATSWELEVWTRKTSSRRCDAWCSPATCSPSRQGERGLVSHVSLRQLAVRYSPLFSSRICVGSLCAIRRFSLAFGSNVNCWPLCSHWRRYTNINILIVHLNYCDSSLTLIV